MDPPLPLNRLLHGGIPRACARAHDLYLRSDMRFPVLSGLRVMIGASTIALLVTTAACSSETGTEETVGAEENLTAGSSNEPVSRDRVPDEYAFKGWQDDTISTSAPRPEDAKRKKLACDKTTLLPTQPQSALKRYHRYAHGLYDNSKLNGESRACKIPGNGRNGRGERTCLAAATLDYAMLSDTYVDTCGNFYRGFWEELYLSTEETMGTLISKGRTVYPVPNAQFSGEVYDGATHAVDASDFVFLSELSPGDTESIAKAKENANREGTHQWDADTGLFAYVGQYR